MKLLLIDGNSLLFRAYFATAFAGADSIMRTSKGYPTNAIYGLANLVTKVLEISKPDYALVAFDTSKPTFRHESYADYKAGRKETPDELKQQFVPAREMLRHMGLFVYEQEGYEADDIVGTTSVLVPNDWQVEIYSGDKDLLQLISDNVTVNLTKKGVTDLKVMTVETLKEEMGISPSQVTDLKGLMGDSSDNIPGVPGVGEKTAVKLISEFNTVENIVEQDIKGKLGEKIKENKELALMSKKLATINKSVPVSYTIEDLKYDGPKDDLGNFYKQYEMYSLEKKIKNMFKGNSTEVISEKAPETVSIEVEFEKVSKIPEEFLNSDLSIVIEIDGNNYHRNNVLCIGVSNGIQTYLISLEDCIKDSKFVEYLSNPSYKKIGIDIKKILTIFKKYNIECKGFSDDLNLASYILETSFKDDPGILFNNYGYSIPYKSEVFKKNSDIDDIEKYIALETKTLYLARSTIREKLREADQLKLYEEVEIPLSYVLSDMESEGIKVDIDLLKSKSVELRNKLDQLTKEIYELSGSEFNINSPSQMAEVLFDKLMLPANKKRSTNAEELAFLSPFHPVIEKIQQYRQYSKLLSGYYDGLQEYIIDGKIHTIYNQTLTQTGRLSSRDPNLQNISVRSEEGKEVRKVFVAGKDHLLISFDYSQIELRVLASMANATSLKEAFKNEVDIHTDTAAKCFNIDPSEVSKEERRQAKVVNFGIMYGMSDFELAKELNIGFNQAKAFIAKYFQTYPEVQNYFSNVIEEGTRTGQVKTMFGRTRRINELNSSLYQERERGKRIAMNTPIQGTAADIMKMQMIKVYNKIKESNLDIKMLLQVHDEIVLEIKESELDEVTKLIKSTMEDFSFIDVPLIVDCHYGKNWME